MLTRSDTVDENAPLPRVYGYTVLIGAGAGCFIQASFAVAQAKVSPSRVADAGGYIALAQDLGIVLALAISGSIFQNVAASNLAKVLPGVPQKALRGLLSGANSPQFKELADATRTKVIAVIVAAMAKNYILVITAGAMAIVGSLFLSVSLIPFYSEDGY